MEVDLIFKIAALGVVIAVLNMVLDKSGKQEYAFFTTLVGVVVVLTVVIAQISNLFQSIKALFNFY